MDLDRKNDRFVAYRMPDRYVLESICDRMAACRIYQGKQYDNASALNYFNHGKDQYFMHPDNAKQFRHYLGIIANVGFNKAIAQLKQLNHK